MRPGAAGKTKDPPSTGSSSRGGNSKSARKLARAVQRLRSDSSGASPLTVISVVVLVAAAVTAAIVMMLFGRGPSVLSLQQTEEGAATSFEVTAVHGNLDWGSLSVQFLDPAGVDQAGTYLVIPQGDVAVGDLLHLRTAPPGGTYLLRVLDGDAELARVALHF